MRFELVDKFTGQKAQREREHSELVRRSQSALEDLQALRAEYERTIRDSLAARKDPTKELDAISDKIEKAEKTFERRRQECALYGTVVPREISEQQIVDAWNTEFKPAYEAQVLNPALERVMAAKSELVDAFLSYSDVVAAYDREKRDVVHEVGDGYQYKFGEIGPRTISEHDMYFVRSGTLWSLDMKQVPDDVVRMIQHKVGAGIKITEAERSLAKRVPHGDALLKGAK